MTDAIVLHSFDYLESSRILRLVTREAGVRSVLARGARRSQRRFGRGARSLRAGLGASCTPSRAATSTRSADSTSSRARPQLAEHLDRFNGAAAIAELALRFARDDADAGLFDAVALALDEIAAAPGTAARDATLAAAWRILAALGVAPTVDDVCGMPCGGRAR